jgi:pimeloyl-ACP methyl ester carboxylesterase
MKTTILPEITIGKEAPSTPGEDFVMPSAISQQRFWVLDQLGSGNTALNIPLALELKGPLDVDVLHKALHAIVTRHETLRTSFAYLDEEVKQVIMPEVRFHFQQKDLTGVPPEMRADVLLQEMQAEAIRPLSLEKAPIFRARLLHLDVEEHALLLTLHHIICDGWSNGLLVKEIGIFYQAILEGRKAVLPEMPIQYADYAVWQREWMKTDDFARQLSFWEKQFEGGLPVLDLPTDYARRTGRMFPSTIESLLLPIAFTDELKRKCHELDMTLFMVFFATYAAMLNRYSGQGQFIIGTTVANRTRPELEPMIGQFSNPMMLRADLADNPTFRELLTRVRDLSLSAMSHQEVPFESILETLESSAGGQERPSIQAHFLFQKAFMQPAKVGDLSLRPYRSVSPGTTFELMFGIVERGEGIRLQLEYNTALFEKRTILRMLRHFRSLLQAALENLDLPVSALPMLSDDERARLWPAPKTSGTLAAETVLGELHEQLMTHFRSAPEPSSAVVEPPPGMALVVLDKQLRLLPYGVPGDLYIAGVAPQTVRGRAVVSGPLDCHAPASLVWANFIARAREDGKFELLGQGEDFVTVHGFRVNLRQVQALLQRHPGVEEAAATIQRPAGGDEQLVCHIVPRAGEMPLEKDLRALLRGRISDYTQPAWIMSVPSLPRDAHGAIMAELLPAPSAPMPAIPQEKAPLEAILYQQMIEIWMEILKVANVSIHDNFFSLGGTSLLGLRMMTQIEKLCGRRLPLSLLLTGATIDNLARYIVETNSESAQPLIAVQAKGTQPPIFFLHGDWAGGGFYCARLAQQLGDDQPFYVLPPYRSGKQDVFSLEEMAAYHVAALRERVPHGPYVLGGYCIGATIAREMARQLATQGQQVSRLLLIDPPLWSAGWFPTAWKCIDAIGNWRGWNLQTKIHYFDRYGVSFSRWLKRPLRAKFLTVARRLGLKVPEVVSNLQPAGEIESGDPEILHSMDYATYFLAYRLYRAAPFEVPATLLFPEDTPPTRIAQVLRRREFNPVPYEVVMIPGNHQTCITKYTAPLAKKMSAALKS